MAYRKVLRTKTKRTEELFSYVTKGSKKFVKTYAAQEEKSMSAIVEEALKHYARIKGKPKTGSRATLTT